MDKSSAQRAVDNTDVSNQFDWICEFKFGGMTNGELVSTMLKKDIVMDARIKHDLIQSASLSLVEQEVQFTRCCVGDLFSDNRRKRETEEVEQEIMKIHPLSHKNAGIHLRLKFLDQPNGDRLYVVTEQLSKKGVRSIYRLASGIAYCRPELRIEMYSVGDRAPWNPRMEIAFQI